MKDETLDVVIIGGGTAGLSALREVRKQTDRFAIIDAGPWGTTCARTGCMPSKALIAAADAFHRRDALEAFGIRGGSGLSVDVPAVLARVRALRDGFVAGALRATEDPQAHAITGRARLLAPDCVEVNGRRLRARHIIVATGSRPVVPDPWRVLGERLLTSDSLFECEDLPRRIAVVGMGAIGVEMAQALSRLGIDVTAFGSHESLAGLGDPVVNEALLESLRQEFAVHVGARASVTQDDHGTIRVRAGAQEVQVDAVLAALGRRPDLHDLGLDALGVPLNDRGLPTIDPLTMRVAGLPVFIVGDVAARLPLQHEAADDGHMAGLQVAALLAGNAQPPQFRRRVPMSIVFSDPEVAVIGTRFSQLDAEQVRIGEVRFDRQSRARIEQRNRGALRLYADAHTGVLLGSELCAPSGGHLAHLLALAIDRRLTVHELLRLPFYHPVLEEGLRTALRHLSSQLPACAPSDLAACAAVGIEALE